MPPPGLVLRARDDCKAEMDRAQADKSRRHKRKKRAKSPVDDRKSSSSSHSSDYSEDDDKSHSSVDSSSGPSTHGASSDDGEDQNKPNEDDGPQGGEPQDGGDDDGSPGGDSAGTNGSRPPFSDDEDGCTEHRSLHVIRGIISGSLDTRGKGYVITSNQLMNGVQRLLRDPNSQGCSFLDIYYIAMQQYLGLMKFLTGEKHPPPELLARWKDPAFALALDIRAKILIEEGAIGKDRRGEP